MATKTEVACRRLGRTNLSVSEISFGSWGIGGGMWQGSDDKQSISALRRAMDLGCNFFDTAYVYGDGHSEQLIAQAFKEAGRRALVASKVPPANSQWPSKGTLKDSFPADWVIRCTERSLKELGADVIDVQQFHVWQDSWLDELQWEKTWTAIERLKKEGKIKFWGVSINSRAPQSAIKLVETGNCDTVQVIFNLFEQEPVEKLFPACQKHDVGVIARVPFDEGGLTGKLTEDTVFSQDDFRSNYFAGGFLKETVKRAKALERILVGPQGEPDLAAAALRFILSFPQVSTIIPGMRTLAHVESNMRLLGAKPYGKDLLKSLKAHAWKRDLPKS